MNGVELLGLLFLGVWLVLVLLGLPGLLTMTRLTLRDGGKLNRVAGEWPRVSIIVTACNEERTIAKGLTSLLAIDYPHLEIIAINDRSTDQTGAIMQGVASKHPSLRILEIDDLPSGWLGKNHALYQGAQLATGEWLLFTDADVVFQPQALKIAMQHARSEQLDHLALAPEMKAKGIVLHGLVLLFMFNLMLFFRPQNAKNPRSKAHMGVGAFNLIKKSVYQAIGTHKVIRMRPDDDLKLGRLVKRNGFRQDFAYAEELLSVVWYPSLSEMIRGLEKNTMAPFEYRIPLLLAGLIPLGLLYLLPFVGPFLAEGWGRAVYLVMLLLGLVSFCLHGRFHFRLVGYYFLFPLTVPLLLYALGRAALLTWRRGGIVWRGTLYPVDMLKQK